MRVAAAGRGRGQRITVVLAIFAVLTSLLVWPIWTPPSAGALTDTHQCGPGDANRASLVTHHGNIAMRPCLTGTNLNFNIPRSAWGENCFLCYERRFQVDEIRRIGLEDVKMADGTTQQLWHFSFAKFIARKNVTMSTTNGTGNSLTFKPDALAQIGGVNNDGVDMYTDFWITDGRFGVAGLCLTPVSADSPLIALVQGADLAGCEINLNIKYLVTYNATPGSTGQYPLRLPRTTVTVS